MRKFGRAVMAALLAYTLIVGLIGPLSHNLQTASGEQPVVAAVTETAYAVSIQEACGDKSTTEKAACEAGYKGAEFDSRTNVCKPYSGDEAFACSNGYDGAKLEQNGNPTEVDAGGATSDKAQREEGCAEKQGPAAWALCPFFDRITNFMAEGGQEIIRQFLVIEPLKFEGPMYDTWNTIRTLANVLFVLIFLVIIFGNTFGANAYHIRSVLPKLVAAAILVQASFLISALAVDVGNILGDGVADLISGVANQGTTPEGPSGSALVGNIFTAAGLGVLLLVGWELALPLFLLVLISAVAMIVTLAFRYFLIGVLIVVSPLAFAAMVLPGTEQYFHRWQGALIKLILMYPIIMVLLSLAANVGALMPISADSGSLAGSAVVNLAPLLIKILVLIAVFSAIPLTFKWAGGFMAVAASRIDDIRKGGVGGVKGGDSWKTGKQRIDSKRANLQNRADKWATSGGGANTFGRSSAAQGAMLGALALATGSMPEGALSRERHKQATISKMMDDFKGLNASRDDRKSLAAARSKSDVAPSLRPYYSVLGQAAALRSLNKDKARDQAASAESALAAMATTATGKQRAEEIRKLAYQGDGGAMFGADPALAGGGLGGKDALKPGSGSKIKSGDIAGIMSSVNAVQRNFGSSLSGGVEKATRQMGEVNAAGKVTGPDFVEKHLAQYGIAGGLATSMSVKAFKDSLKGRHFGETSGDARREMKEALTNTRAQQRIQILRQFESSLRAQGRGNDADEVKRRADNLDQLRQVAQTEITD